MSSRRLVRLALMWVVSLQGPLAATADDQEIERPTIEKKTEQMERHDGFVPFFWDAQAGKIWLQIERFDVDFLYVNALSTGLGSNPVGLDRGQLGGTRIVRFVRVGPRVLLEHRNLRYRAITDDEAERRAVDESFARSILWGAEVAAETDGRVLVDATDFLMRDAHQVTARLRRSGQREFRLDTDRSALFLDRTRNFPRNTEFEVTLTFESSDPGPLVVETTPTPESVTVRQHHSFVALPDDGYRTRRFDPRAPSLSLSYADYATPIDQPLEQRLIIRHRLQKRNPDQPVSEPVEPIVYYVDRGAPEPVRTALVEGASWWNQAFEAAGFKNGFRVELLPEDADPLDVRFNVIMWVHRSTRGWSYGNSVVDPRTGEIIKGHVSLGSLRVRQDLLLMDGLLPVSTGPAQSCGCGSHAPAFGESFLAGLDSTTQPIDVALARIRQLSAHEVGHTLGFAHNFAASTNDRASVMDYPAPFIGVSESDELDLSNAYAVGIGRWDVFSVKFAYTEFRPGADESSELGALVKESRDEGLLFLSDRDARPAGAAHPLANLWDNGADPIDGLKHAMTVRRIGLAQFSAANLPDGRPMASLEATFVPLYLHHRYQVDAAAKMLGGVDYRYSVKGDPPHPPVMVPRSDQRRALDALLECLEPEALAVRPEILELLPPQPYGYGGGRERFSGRTAMIFDPLAAVEVAADLVVAKLLQRQRAARLISPQAPDGLNLQIVIDELFLATWFSDPSPDKNIAAIQRTTQQVVLNRLLELARDSAAASDVRAVAEFKLETLHGYFPTHPGRGLDQMHRRAAGREIDRFLNRPSDIAQPPTAPVPPPGSPIGDDGNRRLR